MLGPKTVLAGKLFAGFTFEKFSLSQGSSLEECFGGLRSCGFVALGVGKPTKPSGSTGFLFVG